MMSTERRLAGVLVALEAAAVVLLPKCPLCIVAALSLSGVSAGAAWAVAPYVPWLALLVLPLAAATWIWRRRRAQCACPGGGTARRAPCCEYG